MSCKALREQMQSFAWADAKLCVGRCKALRGRLQSFAWTIAMLCVRVGLNWHRKVCPILDKIKGGKTHPTGHLAPRKFLLNPYIRSVLNVHCLCALCAFARAFSRRRLLRGIFLAKPPRSQGDIVHPQLRLLRSASKIRLRLLECLK